MGTYINTGNAGFQSARNSEYVDKLRSIRVWLSGYSAAEWGSLF